MNSTAKTQRHLEEKRKLPEGWRWAKLREVADVVNGFGFAESLQGRKDLPYPFIKVSDMNAPGAEIVIEKATNTVDDEILRHLCARCYPKGTIVFPKVGGALLTNKKRVLGRDSSFDNNIMGVVPKHIDREFLYYWLCTIDMTIYANTQALPSIRQSVVASFEIPLPPLSEQRRIAVALKDQMAAVEKARAAAQARLEAVKALPAAFLRQVFPQPGQPLPDDWRWAKLGDVIHVRSGDFLPATSMDSDGIFPVYGGNGVTGFHGAYMFEEPKVIIGRVGALCGCVHLTEPKSWITDNALYVSEKKCALDDSFLFFLLTASDLRSLANQMGQPVISGASIYAAICPIPPFIEQQYITSILKEQMAATDKAREAAEEELSTINALPAALLRRAFSGEV